MMCQKNTWNLRGFLTGTLLMVLVSVLAQNVESPRIVNFSTEEYMAQKQNWSIGQLATGMMCFANTAGLLTFDGVNWVLHEMPHRQIIRALLIDDDRIYVGSYGEFGFWSADPDGLFLYTSLIPLLDPSLTDGEEIWNIIKSGNKIIFHSFGTIFQLHHDELRRIEPPYSIRFIHPIDSDLDMLQVTGYGLMQYVDNSFVEKATQEELEGLKVTGMCRFDRSEILVATERNGLFMMHNNELHNWPTVIDSMLTTHQINKLTILDSNLIAIGTISDGLFILNHAGELISHINKNSGLQNNTILALFKDHTNNLWLGLDDGIALIDLNNPTRFYQDFNGKIGTVYDAVVFDDWLYIGTNQGLFHRPYNSKSVLNQHDFTLVDGSQGQVWDLKKIGSALLVGHNNGTYDVSSLPIKHISKVSGGWDLELVPGHKDKLIQGTYTGLVTFHRKENQWQFANQVRGFTGSAKHLAFENSGSIWVANPYRGLHRLLIDFERDSVISLQTFDQSQGLPSDFNLSLLTFGEKIHIRSAQQYFEFDEERKHFYPSKIEGFTLNNGEKLICAEPEMTFKMESNL
ncbi:MAG: hypothetical protein HKN76_16845, partial [Saprospiraceae bacterium]|nr:hypothetical protein [Saprospiraceae bacterium]